MKEENIPTFELKNDNNDKDDDDEICDFFFKSSYRYYMLCPMNSLCV